MNTQEKLGKIISSLILSRRFIKDGHNLDTLLCANGPSIDFVIDKAIQLAKEIQNEEDCKHD